MKRTLFILITSCALAACGDSTGDTGGSGGGGNQDVSSILALTGDASAGASVFSSSCGSSSCHGSDGNSGSDSSAKLSDAVPDLSDEALARIIKYGENSMPPVNIQDQQIADAMAYCRENFN